jgi:hypothetical protein
MSSVEGARVAKENLRRGQAAADETALRFEQGFSACRDFNLKMIETMRSHADATFDLAEGLMTARSPQQAFEVWQSFAERQVDTVQKQAGQLAAMTQEAAAQRTRTVTDTADRLTRS